MKKVVTLGELIVRLSPSGYTRFVQASSLDIIYGGVEANVCASLATYGLNPYFVSKLPKNHAFADAAIANLKSRGVNTNYVARGGDRLALYFLENGCSLRPSKVIYDRANSAMSQATCNDFNFDEIFDDCHWFHFSGITPGISDEAALVCEEALKAAKAKGVTVSLDVNYRQKLWGLDKAQEVLSKLTSYVDVFIGSEFDVKLVLGMDVNTEIDCKELYDMAIEKFGFKYIVTTKRKVYSASDNNYSAFIYDGNEFYYSKDYDLRIVDRVGTGDSFTSGFLYSLIDTNDHKYALEFGVAASALKNTIPGDCNYVSKEEVEAVVSGDVSGKVQR